MSIPHSNSEINETATPQLYLLQMDSNINLTSNDSQAFPLHLLNNISDYNYKQFLRIKQEKHEAQQDQREVLIDTCPDADVEYVAIQTEKSYYQDLKLTQSGVQNHNVIPSSVSPLKHLSGDISGTELIAPSLVNSNDHTEEIAHKRVEKENGIKHYIHISDRSVLPRAVAVLPTVLQIRRKDIVSPRRILSPRTRFGPVQGVKNKISTTELNELKISSAQNKTPLFIVRDKDALTIYIDVSDKDKANWIGLLPLGDENTANVWIYEDNNELFIITTEAVPTRKQLMLGYSKRYAQDYGLIGPTKDIETALISSKKWWCYECQRAMPSAALLDRHMASTHQEDYTVSRRRYGCRYCSRTFSRIFTMRRHIARNCEKKVTKSNATHNTETLPETSLNSSLNTDDNRVPSDESFQNYSNGLDFSTNLFDTDRMPSLYISGNSRSEVFNPYGLDSENTLTNDLGYANGCSMKTDISPSTDNKKVEEEDTEPTITKCSHCKQDIPKGKKRQHVSECPAKRFECECKMVFRTKEQLGLHVFNQHSKEKLSEEEQKQKGDNNTVNPTPYQCEQCQHTFKRRGMLVNHLWRVHQMAASRVPLERRVRHYPCVACPKIYRTAAKRDRHVTVHHPGMEKLRAAPLEGGSRPASPARCAACPRQYSTRAKLLQHVRYCHPHLKNHVRPPANTFYDNAPPPPKKTNSKQKSNNTNERLKASEDLLRNKTSLQQLLNFY